MTIDSEQVKLRLLASVMIACLVSACSSDAARFSANPFQNPFNGRQGSDPASTASVDRAASPAPLRPVPSGAASTRPLATTQSLPVPTQPMMRAGQPATGAGQVAAAAYPALSPVPPRPSTALGSPQGWTAIGGTPVTLQPGEGLATLSARYGVPVSALLAVNGLSSVSQAQPGQQIMVPAYNAVQGPGGPLAQGAPKRLASAARANVAEAKPAAAPRPPVREVSGKAETEAEKRAAEKLRQIRTREADEDNKPASAAPRPASSEKPVAPAKTVTPAKTATPIAATPTAEKVKGMAAAPAAEKVARVAPDKMPAQQAQLEPERKRLETERAKQAEIERAKQAEIDRKAKLAAKKPASDPETTASIPEPKVASRMAPAPAPATASAAPPADEEPAESAANFRWPAQGRVIAGFGARSAAGANDGINIAVPEGTPVRAAEGGTVIHADDALKGYGKLVLVRHPNGYVSVYAHNGEIKVKRGESVRRGQVIAASGSSGNVTSPQLHFQIRKGSQAVDPMKVLSAN